MQLHYHIFGNGPRPMLVFHGIGQTGEECFRSFGAALAPYYTIYAFDLPFHGESSEYFSDERWSNGKEPILREEWKDYLSVFLANHSITKFSIAGFSLGGRFALATLSLFFDRIESAFLIAPDGITVRFMYRLATETRLMRHIFKRVMDNPRTLSDTAVFLNKRNLLNSSLLRILKRLTATSRHARLVYLSWINFRKLKMDRTLLQQSDEKLNSKVFLFLGKYDLLITRREIQPLANVLSSDNVVVLDAGHSTSVEQTANYIKQKMLN